MSATRAERDESGAVAIMVAIMALVLMGTAALAVDMGQAFTRKREIQYDTDRAALAGGAGNNLPTPATTSTCAYGNRANSSDQAIKDVVASLNSQPGAPTTSVSEMRDCNTDNGEVFYGSVTQNAAGTYVLTYSKNRLSVLSPPSRVDFGLARAIGKANVDVRSVSTVSLFSPRLRTLPLYAFTGCDYGHQTIAQPNNGHAGGQSFSHDTESNVASVDSLATSPATSPPAVPIDAYLNPATDSLVITGKKFSQGPVTAVGFFEAGYSGTGPEPVEMTTGFTIDSATKITIAHMPQAVTTAADYWYVRVKVGGQWSSMYPTSSTLTPSVVVGTPTLTCAQGSSAGNFGTLLVPHSQGPNGQSANIAYNIAVGLEHPMGIFPTAVSPWTCTAASVGARLWPTDGTNCVDTKTGLDLNAANDGFLNGVSGKPGKLTNVATGTGCAANGAPATKPFGVYTINNDSLTCFFTDNTTNVGDIDGPTYTGAPVLSSAIYDSPRFALVPVFGVQPANGGSNKYQVIGFRAAFITDQPNSATKSSAVTAANGITGSTSIESLQVVFFNDKALPQYQGTDVQAYQGIGPKVMRLIN